ncbi:MAG: metal-binding protein [Acidocella sp. 20-57-95]|nr:MAG: metal-binding protein [Acidocella sp. 20-57-95]
MNNMLKYVVFALTAVTPLSAIAAPIQATLYKNPECDCCQNYAQYLDKNGFDVKVIPSPNLDALTQEAGVPTALDGCHLTKIDGYVIEGHVPASIVKKLLTERPPIKGIAIAGMPAGVPGMPSMAGMSSGPIYVYEVGTSTPVIYATIPPGEF